MPFRFDYVTWIPSELTCRQNKKWREKFPFYLQHYRNVTGADDKA